MTTTTKKPEVPVIHRISNWYEFEGYDYILTATEGVASMVSINTGNCFASGVICENLQMINGAEFSLICDGDTFKYIKQVTYSTE